MGAYHKGLGELPWSLSEAPEWLLQKSMFFAGGLKFVHLSSPPPNTLNIYKIFFCNNVMCLYF